MRKKIAITVSIILGITLISLAVYYVYSLRTPVLTTAATNADLTELDAQMEYIDFQDNNLKFLTYRETAFAEINPNTGNYSVITDQIIDGMINLVYWYPDNENCLIEFVNDPSTLSANKTYVDSKNEFVHATYHIGDKEVEYIDNGMDSVWLSGSAILGLKDNRLYSYKNSAWGSTNIETSGNRLIIPTKGAAFGDYNNNKLTVYNKDFKIIRVLEQKFDNSLRIKIFDNGDVFYTDNESVTIYPANGKTKQISLSDNDQMISGNNILLYSQNKTNYAYFSPEQKVYKVEYAINNVDYYKMFGLNTVGFVYFTGDDYTANIVKFKS